tara:strand:- start:1418 stop:1690 length:273 start_codon:yes stop_codon:yes gene_type:complete
MKDNKQTYTHLKDFNHDMSYENESKITNDNRGPSDLEKVISDLKNQLADARIIDSVHQKLNGSLQKRVRELEVDNKRLVKEIDDLKERIR